DIPSRFSGSLSGSTITCSGGSATSDGKYWYAWYQQKNPGIDPVTVICENSNRTLGIPLQFPSSLSGSTARLNITGIQAEDEAVYYCGSRDSSGAGLMMPSMTLKSRQQC
uniref:Ig-like domain-containing protein n=1 Tax=Anas zonorhyncha TaxID=75864 RepID=A0A8B9UK94_9AVES